MKIHFNHDNIKLYLTKEGSKLLTGQVKHLDLGIEEQRFLMFSGTLFQSLPGNGSKASFIR